MTIGIRIADDQGTTLFHIQDFIRFEAVRSLGQVDGCRLLLPDDRYGIGDFRRDMIITFTYDTHGLGVFWVFFLRQLGRVPGMIVLDCDGPNMVLEDRIVAYPAHTSYTTKTNQADDLMKQIVYENLGGGAVAARDLSDYVSIAADYTQGPSLTKSFAWQNVLTTLQDLQGQALVQGTKIYFDMVPALVSGRIRLTFNTYLNQPGIDRTVGIEQMIFSEGRNNLINPALWYVWRQRPTYAYALGQGEGEDRTLQSDAAASLNASLWSRVESYVDARMSETDASVLAEARRELAERGPIVRFEGDTVDVDGSRFGVDWGFGDRVIAVYERVEYPCLIDKVHISLVADDPIAVSAKLLYEGLIT